MQGGGEDIGVGEGWVAGVEEGERAEMGEVGGGGACGPGMNCGGKGTEGV